MVRRPDRLGCVEARQHLEPANVALHVGESADHVDADRVVQVALAGGHRLGARGRAGVARLEDGDLRLGRRGDVVDRPRPGGGQGLAIQGRHVGGGRVGRGRRNARPDAEPGEGQPTGQHGTGHQPSSEHPSSSVACPAAPAGQPASHARGGSPGHTGPIVGHRGTRCRPFSVDRSESGGSSTYEQVFVKVAFTKRRRGTSHPLSRVDATPVIEAHTVRGRDTAEENRGERDG